MPAQQDGRRSQDLPGLERLQLDQWVDKKHASPMRACRAIRMRLPPPSDTNVYPEVTRNISVSLFTDSVSSSSALSIRYGPEDFEKSCLFGVCVCMGDPGMFEDRSQRYPTHQHMLYKTVPVSVICVAQVVSICVLEQPDLLYDLVPMPEKIPSGRKIIGRLQLDTSV